MKIPYDRLEPNTLRNMVEEFVTRSGTDYGEEEATLEEKVDQVIEQLKNGKASVVYDEESQSCNIVGSVS